MENTESKCVAVETFVNQLMKQWDALTAKSKAGFLVLVRFLMDGLDQLMKQAERVIASGPDKKEAVVNGIKKIYRYVTAKTLPLWLKPFRGTIESHLLVFVSFLIDWMVSKYNEGSWKQDQGGSNEHSEEAKM